MSTSVKTTLQPAECSSGAVPSCGKTLLSVAIILNKVVYSFRSSLMDHLFWCILAYLMRSKTPIRRSHHKALKLLPVNTMEKRKRKKIKKRSTIYLFVFKNSGFTYLLTYIILILISVILYYLLCSSYLYFLYFYCCFVLYSLNFKFSFSLNLFKIFSISQQACSRLVINHHQIIVDLLVVVCALSVLHLVLAA